jgi:hypothetical protein
MPTTHEVRNILEEVISKHIQIDDASLVDITTEIIEQLEESGLWDEENRYSISGEDEPSYSPFDD